MSVDAVSPLTQEKLVQLARRMVHRPRVSELLRMGSAATTEPLKAHGLVPSISTPAKCFMMSTSRAEVLFMRHVWQDPATLHEVAVDARLWLLTEPHVAGGSSFELQANEIRAPMTAIGLAKTGIFISLTRQWFLDDVTSDEELEDAYLDAVVPANWLTLPQKVERLAAEFAGLVSRSIAY